MNKSNEIAEFAMTILKLYAFEKHCSVRSTSDLSQLEEWLIIKLANETKNSYLLTEWPEVQSFMEKENFRKNSCLANDEEFLEENCNIKSSAYFIKKTWLNEVISNEENYGLNLDKMIKRLRKKKNEILSVLEKEVTKTPEPINLVAEINKMGNTIIGNSKEITDLEVKSFLNYLETQKSLSEEEFSILQSDDKWTAAYNYLKRKQQ